MTTKSQRFTLSDTAVHPGMIERSDSYAEKRGMREDGNVAAKTETVVGLAKSVLFFNK